jgi:sucrose phosphorylase
MILYHSPGTERCRAGRNGACSCVSPIIDALLSLRCIVDGPAGPDTERKRAFTEASFVIIAYPDHLSEGSDALHLRGSGRPPLKVLGDWALRWVVDPLASLAPTGAPAGNDSAVDAILHVLPFHPSNGYDGYCITDYTSVDPAFGSWDSFQRNREGGSTDGIHTRNARLTLMTDLVLNHCSSDHPWFQAELAADSAKGARRSRFVTSVPPDAPWLRSVLRARQTPLISSFSSTSGGLVHAWTTYHPQMVDLDWSNPNVFVEFLSILVKLARRGFRGIRLDAFGYVWKSAESSCVNQPMLKVLLEAIRGALDYLNLGDMFLLPSLTNVSQLENLEMLTHGASLAYHLPLPALLLHSIYSGCAVSLASAVDQFSRQIQELRVPTGTSCMLNLSTTHDGIGLTWCRRLLPEAALSALVDEVCARGGIFMQRPETAGGSSSIPWEVCTTFWSACRPERTSSDPTPRGSLGLHVSRFLLAQSVVASLQGVPAFYFGLWMCAENDTDRVKARLAPGVDRELHCAERNINRGRFCEGDWEARVKDPALPQGYVWRGLLRILHERRLLPALSPVAPQHILTSALHPSLLVIVRGEASAEGVALQAPEHGYPPVVCLFNFAAQQVLVDATEALRMCVSIVTVSNAGVVFNRLAHATSCAAPKAHDEVPGGGERLYDRVDLRMGLLLRPYEAMWLTDGPFPATVAVLRRFQRHARKVLAARWHFPAVSQSAVALAQKFTTREGGRTGPPKDGCCWQYEALPLEASFDPTLGRCALVRFLHHGASFHKEYSAACEQDSGRRRKDRCFEHTMPREPLSPIVRRFDKILAAASSFGGKSECPYMDEAVMDSPLTEEGVAKSVLRRDNEFRGTVLASSLTRTLQTALLMFPNAARVVPSSNLWPLQGRHCHAQALPVSTRRALFPGLNFCEEAAFDEPVDSSGPSKEDWESRASMEARCRRSLDELFDAAEGENVTVVAVSHFSHMFCMLIGGEDGRVFGAREYGTAPVLLSSQHPGLQAALHNPASIDHSEWTFRLVRWRQDSPVKRGPAPAPLVSSPVCNSLPPVLLRSYPWRLFSSIVANWDCIAVTGFHSKLLSRDLQELLSRRLGKMFPSSLKFSDLAWLIVHVSRLIDLVAAEQLPAQSRFVDCIAGCFFHTDPLAVATMCAAVLRRAAYCSLPPSQSCGYAHAVMLAAKPRVVVTSCEHVGLLQSMNRNSGSTAVGGVGSHPALNTVSDAPLSREAFMEYILPLLSQGSDTAGATCSDSTESGVERRRPAYRCNRHSRCHIAYVPFSSGSTGSPKGSLLCQQGMQTFLDAVRSKELSASPDNGDTLFDRAAVVLQHSSHAFDIHWLECVGPLLHGGCLVLRGSTRNGDDDDVLDVSSFDAAELTRSIQRHGVTWLFLVPAAAKDLAAHLTTVQRRTFESTGLMTRSAVPSLRSVYFGGDVSDSALPYLLQSVLPSTCTVFHIYGPSECTIYSTCWVLPRPVVALRDNGRHSRVPLGVPYDGYELFILPLLPQQPCCSAPVVYRPADFVKLQGDECKGVLCIAGDGILKGYLSPLGSADEPVFDSSHEASDFCGLKRVTLPSAFPIEQAREVFATGDIVELRKRDDSFAMFWSGRVDRQTKLRGQRVDLDAVEAQCRAFTRFVDDVAAIVLPVPGASSEASSVLAALVKWKADSAGDESSDDADDGRGSGEAVSSLHRRCRRLLTRHLASQAPSWMVPQVLVEATAARGIPRSGASLKVDYKQVRAMLENALPTTLPKEHNASTKKSGSERQIASPLTVGIVGAGVAGLLTAKDCCRRGPRSVSRAIVFDAGPSPGGVWANGTASPSSCLQQPCEFYVLGSTSYSHRYPSTAEIQRCVQHEFEVLCTGTEHESERTLVEMRFNTKVISIVPCNRTGCIKLITSAGGIDAVTLVDRVVVCTGLFHHANATVPRFLAGRDGCLSSSRGPLVRYAFDFSPEKDCAGRHVVVVGGGPYAVEALAAICSCARLPLSVVVVIRRPHPVVPKCWFEQPQIVRLFPIIFSGTASLPVRRMWTAMLCLHYLRHDIPHMFSSAMRQTDPKTAISDDFFVLAKRLHIPKKGRDCALEYRIGEINDISPGKLEVSIRGRSPDSGAVWRPCDVMIVACGFRRPTLDLLSSIADRPRAYLGTILVQEPRIALVGLSIGYGIFANPFTMRPQVEVAMNHLCEHSAAFVRSKKEMDVWFQERAALNADAQDGESFDSEEIQGLSFATVADYFLELRWQAWQKMPPEVRDKLCSRTIAHKEQELTPAGHSMVLSDEGTVLRIVLSTLQRCSHGVSLAANTDLAAVGVDSIRFALFRSSLVTEISQFMSAGANAASLVPSVSSLLWDLTSPARIAKSIFMKLRAAKDPSPSTRLCCSPAAGLSPTENTCEENAPLLTESEALHFLRDHLGIQVEDAAVERCRGDAISFLTRIAERFHAIVPFQSFSLMMVPVAFRRLPSLQQVKRDVLEHTGGCCFVLNVFLRELLRALGFTTYYARCAIHGVQDCHMTVLLRHVVVNGDLYLMDVGCGYIFPRPIRVDLLLRADGVEETPPCDYSGLTMKYTRYDPGKFATRPRPAVADGPGPGYISPLVIHRLHADTSTFEPHELVLRHRADGFGHHFWSMSPDSRPLHDTEGETQQTRAYIGYGKIRASIGIPCDSDSAAGPVLMKYFKADVVQGRFVAKIITSSSPGSHGLFEIKSDVCPEDFRRELQQAFPGFADGIGTIIERFCAC